jgi:hypothetical protein
LLHRAVATALLDNQLLKYVLLDKKFVSFLLLFLQVTLLLVLLNVVVELAFNVLPLKLRIHMYVMYYKVVIE